MAEKDPQIVALYPEIVAKRLSKKDAAARLGMSYPHLCVSLKRLGLLDAVRTPRAGAVHDSEQMAAALAQALRPDNVDSNAQTARQHELPASQYAAFSMRVLHAKRSRLKRTLRNDPVQDSGAAGPP